MTQKHLTMEIKPTFDFFRKFHRIPASQKLCWCLINDPDEDDWRFRRKLGVWLVGTSKAIDVAEGEFVQLRDNPVVQNECLRGTIVLCQRESDGDYYRYIPEDGTPLRLPKYFVNDAYYARVYSKDMIDSYML